MTPESAVRLYLELTAQRDFVGIDKQILALRGEGLDAEEAECVVAFVPIAFVHVLFSASPVEFNSSFIVRDLETGESVQKSLSDEPFFVAARSEASRMFGTTGEERDWARRVAEASAEYSVITQLSGPSRDLRGIVLTEPLLIRVPMSRYADSSEPARKWWRFW